MLLLSGNLAKKISPALFVSALVFATAGYSQGPYKLSYGWAVDQKLQYSIYIVGKVIASEGTQDIRIQYADLWEVGTPDKDRGLYRVTEKSLKYSGTAFDLRPFGLPNDGDQVERMMDQYGLVASVTRYSEGSRYHLLPLILPKVPVKPEDKWKLSHKTLVPFLEHEVPADVVIVYTFEEISRNYKGRGRDCARIRVDANYLYEIEGGNSGVKGAYQGRFFFDIKEQKLVDYQITENRREWSGPERASNTSIQVTSIAQP